MVLFNALSNAGRKRTRLLENLAKEESGKQPIKKIYTSSIKLKGTVR
jgi:hypothetical protein